MSKHTMVRSSSQVFIDFITFPLRAFTIFEHNRWGLSSLRTERFDYVSREVEGECLDVGCGKQNLFVKSILNGKGKGIDVFPYEGLTEENIVLDMTKFPFPDSSFQTVTFIANINHVPKPKRDAELSEAYRVLTPGGKIIVTMGSAIAEILVHKVVWLSDKLFKTNVDMDTERGMEEDEEYYLTDKEIIERLQRAGFKNIRKKYFLSQWGLNHLFVGEKIA
jgi:SAM-dependent methyltransferase